ncbi:acetyl-CoA hydrolase/transferase family protein [Bartonella sp. TP]|uniref:acetyl-CoA hydrolase/transferase family protein n=1 Tax=Bartonella sp. TP TaxID=3057550 RepID=UPI0025B25212|nr:acetyl-CoA hydrolase/transferase family protein [Bartonella sp. TP]WJW79680.1 acetyl-CoA hydrolase/transferase family protein [Bartonella sp. TP]
MYKDRIRYAGLESKVVSAQEAAAFVQDGMVVGMSGFTKAGDVKLLPKALAQKAEKAPFKITLITGASLGHDTDKILCEAGILARRLPFQVDVTLRKAINAGQVMFIDQHLSETAEQLRNGHLRAVDCAIVEAAAITEDGGIIPTTSVGNSANFIAQAKKVIIELNTTVDVAFEGLHDIYAPKLIGDREPIAITGSRDRIGLPYIPLDPNKIAAIVISNIPDSPAVIAAADKDTQAIADHLVKFFEKEIEKGRLTPALLPLQAGIGAIANAVLGGFVNSSFRGLEMYSEVLQDSTFDLIDSGKLEFASASSITLTEPCSRKVFDNIKKYKDKLVLRPQEISNASEIIRRLGIIAINTALEFDIYGNVNSTHVCGTHMMNGIGGSGDFARNAYLSIFVTKSIAKDGNISSVVPMVSHVDHAENDVDIVATEIGLADLRGLAPRERARAIIDNCVHPIYREKLNSYFERAIEKRAGHTPHILEEAFSWHTSFIQSGSMK